MSNLLVYLFICVVFFVSTIEAPADQNQDADLSVYIVWAEPAQLEYAIFFSAKSAAGWMAPVKISDNDNLNITPAITIDSAGMTWIVWSVVEGTEIHLYYRQYHYNTWGGETKIDTGLRSNTSPTLLIDGNGTVWLAWAGNNGQDDEIYISRWFDGTFDTPVQITDNLVPDILPVLSINDNNNQPRIDWLQFCDYGNCAYYTLLMDNTWNSPLPVDSDNNIAVGNSTPVLSKKKFQVPDFVKKPQSASVYIKGDNIQSLPLRMIHK